MQGFGLRRRSDAELAFQRVPADLILAKRLRAITGIGVESHQRSMRLLARRIELEEALCGPARGATTLEREQSCQDVDRPVVQPGAFDHEPVGERLMG